MTRLLTPSRIVWNSDGTPVDAVHADVYFSIGDGLAETRAVFLEGCGLPAGWAGRTRFTVAETGFGTGLNFLALWQLWREHRPAADAILTFVSFEGYPMVREDAARALAAWPELADLASRLLEGWPEPVRGVRERAFPDAGVRLVLHLGEIAATLPDADFRADAWFLDGFSPARNEAMWHPDVLRHVARCSAPGARLATFTVAGSVRRGLTGAGFAVRKAAGHGRKRERLEAQCVSPASPAPDIHGLRGPDVKPERVAILGAGIAGAALAHRLQADGFDVTVFDQAAGPAQGASGNPLALLMPRLDAADTPEAALLIDAYLAARAFYRPFEAVTETGVLQRPRNSAEAARFERLRADPPLPLEDLEAADGGALLHKRALILDPKALVGQLLSGVRTHFDAPVQADLERRTVNGAEFDAIMLANGMDAARLIDSLPLEARLGQVDWTVSSVEVPACAIASGSYALACGRLRLWGATFEKSDGDFAPDGTPQARAENLAALEGLAPWWIRDARSTGVHSRASLRATTPDRLPLIGAVPDAARAASLLAGYGKGNSAGVDAPLMPGVFITGGFGARGFTWAPWAAELLAARLSGAPVPAALAALRAVSPMRFVLRRLRRG